MNADGSDQRFLADAGGQDEGPVFSADSQTVYFIAERPACCQIWQVPTAGGAASPLRDNANNVVCGEDISLSPDGNSLFFWNSQLMEIDLTTGQVTGRSDDSIEAWIGPDGAHFTFISSDFDLASGGDVMISNLDGSNPVPIITSGDAFFPRWSQPYLTPAENR